MILLFEPWNLGDAIIAASVARLAPNRIILACNSRWHEVLTLASEGSLNLLPLDLPYVWRTNKKFFSLGEAASVADSFKIDTHQISEVISIRGDIRDLIAARRIFRGTSFKFSGWLPFCARKIPLVDLPFKLGFLKVRNRYHAWAEAAGVSLGEIEKTYLAHPEKQRDAPIVIHVGAQWRSKQYPLVAELAELIENAGNRVEIFAGPNDTLPPGVSENMVQRPQWKNLVTHLYKSRYVITNDSGPMHLAAFMGCRTVVFSRCSNIQEWLPPGVTALSSHSAPHGYRPVPDYWSDNVQSGWPSLNEAMSAINCADQGQTVTNNQVKYGCKTP